MGAAIVGNVKLAVDVEDRDNEAGGLNLERSAGRNLIDLAELDACGHRLLLLKGDLGE